MKHNQKVGKWGEDAVAVYLAERGYEILTRNARIDAITPQVLQESFKRFFPKDRSTVVTLVPAPSQQ